MLNKESEFRKINFFYGALLLMLGGVPWFFLGGDASFLIDLLLRGMILSIAALSLYLILEGGGLVSFGHAAFIGIGAYSVGIPVQHEIYNGYFHVVVALFVGGGVAWLSAKIIFRTSGIYFILITLCIGQMLYFLMSSQDTYGGDDGLVILQRSVFPGMVDIDLDINLYWVTYTLLCIVILGLSYLLRTPFGKILQAIKNNEQRAEALGYDVLRYKQFCYVLSGMICSVAGVLLANFNNFISPEMIGWQHSGELIFMVVAGGSSIFGPLLGSFFFVFFEEWFSDITVYWGLLFGGVLMLLVLRGENGLHGLFSKIIRLGRHKSDDA